MEAYIRDVLKARKIWMARLQRISAVADCALPLLTAHR
jgi:hypothetical protein